jgi:WD40 repeat protein
VLKVWDAGNADEPLPALEHLVATAVLAFSPDKKRLASCGSDGLVKVWDVRTGKELLSFKGQTQLITGVAFSPDGKRLASIGSDNIVRVWDAHSGKDLLTLGGWMASSDGLAFMSDSEHLQTATSPYLLRIPESENGEDICAVRLHTLTEGLPQAGFEPGRPLLATPTGNTVRIWSVPRGRADALASRLARMAAPDPAWHEDQARQAAVAGDWFAAGFHLIRWIGPHPFRR